jgi:hypothetical protein
LFNLGYMPFSEARIQQQQASSRPAGTVRLELTSRPVGPVLATHPPPPHHHRPPTFDYGAAQTSIHTVCCYNIAFTLCLFSFFSQQDCFFHLAHRHLFLFPQRVPIRDDSTSTCNNEPRNNDLIAHQTRLIFLVTLLPCHSSGAALAHWVETSLQNTKSKPSFVEKVDIRAQQHNRLQRSNS